MNSNSTPKAFFSQRRKGAKKDNTLLKKSLNNEDLDLVFAIPTAFLKQRRCRSLRAWRLCERQKFAVAFQL
jgi:hypothetical protein